MRKLSIGRLIISTVTALSIAVTLINFSMFSASAFDKSYISEDGMKLGYSIVNGYTKMFLRKSPENYNGKAVVYSGLDITQPYTLTMGGMYVLTHKIDIDKLLSDNDYALTNFDKFNSYLSFVGIKNDKAKEFEKILEEDNIKCDVQMNTLGMYIINSDKEYLYELMEENEYADFVLVNGGVPENMKDLNFDGITDAKDAVLIQHYLADDLDLADDDERAYALFASDYNQDKRIDIQDVTDLLYDLSR